MFCKHCVVSMNWESILSTGLSSCGIYVMIGVL